MNIKSEKQILAERTLTRASSGLYFLEDIVLSQMSGGTDVAYSRSLYILLSINLELILTSLFVLASTKTAREEIIRELISASRQHDFAYLFSKIPASYRFGINSVTKDESSGFTEYHIELNNGYKIRVQDLVDVRYDFKKDDKRENNLNEIDDMKTMTAKLLEIVKNIRANFAI